jgi:AcrR family transcriptional regulator
MTGLRERKKMEMRRTLSDAAARLFLERGFDAVRVAEVADACGVSEKTVFNYFPSKEALLLDRLSATETSLRTDLADRDVPPVTAALAILDAELAAVTSSLAAPAAVDAHLRFGDMIRRTPSLRAYRSDMLDRFVTVAATALASRTGADPEDPEPQVMAAALIGLWRVQFLSLRRHLPTGSPPGTVHERVTADVRRAAAVLSSSPWPAATSGASENAAPNYDDGHFPR